MNNKWEKELREEIGRVLCMKQLPTPMKILELEIVIKQLIHKTLKEERKNKY